MILKGYFYDGKTSTPIPAELSLDNDYLVIKLNTGEVKKWDKNQVEYSDYDSGRVNFTFTDSNDDFESFEFKARNPEDLARIRKAFYSFKKDTVSKLLYYNYKALIPISIFIVAFVLLSYFIFIPELSEKLSVYIPPEIELELGKGIKESILKSETIDTLKSEKLQAYFNSLKLKSKYNYHLYVYKDTTEINAFALPGGTIFVTSGLFNKIKTYPMLSALLFHEASHIENKHSVKSLFRSLSRSMFLSLVFGDVNGMISFVTENANTIYSLNYSRELEMEADKFASEEMKKRNIDQNGLVSLFQLLKEYDLEFPKFLNTHPLTEDRIKQAQKYKELYPNYNTDTVLIIKFNQIKS